MKCFICQKEFQLTNHLKIHINFHHNVDEMTNEKNYIRSQKFISDADFEEIKKMYLEGYTAGDLKEKFGVSLGKYIELLGIKRSASESKKTNFYREKFEKTNLLKYGVSNPSQSKTIKEKKKQTFLKNFGYENNFCNSKIRIKAQKNIDYVKAQESLVSSLIIKYGSDVTNIAQIPGVGEKIGKSQKERLSKMTPEELREITRAARENVKYVSSHELRIQKILNELDIEYTANGFLYAYNWDFIFRNKIILEIQGDFWHGNPKFYKETDILLDGLSVKDVWSKDKNKREKVEKHGYKVYYLWENSIVKMTDEEIVEYLKEILC
jgi:G:T-mismatch repair DNA endonuclease (very short patch repair protein)